MLRKCLQIVFACFCAFLAGMEIVYFGAEVSRTLQYNRLSAGWWRTADHQRSASNDKRYFRNSECNFIISRRYSNLLFLAT